MGILDLPTEIILSIADELRNSSDVFYLSLANKALSHIFLPAAYHFNIRHEGSFILHWAVCNGKLQLAQALVEEFHADVNTHDYKRRSPIFLAIRHENKDIVDLLLSQEKINLRKRTRRGFTPLLYAAFKGSSSMVDALVNEHRVETNVYDNEDRSALWYAVSHGMRAAVQQFCQAGSNINRPDWDGLTPLKLAIAKRNVAMVKDFLKHCRNVLHMPTC